MIHTIIEILTRDELISAVPATRFVTNSVVTVILAIIILSAVLIDLADAVYTARILGEKIRSHRLRNTVSKLYEYWRLLGAGFLADCVCCFVDIYDLPYVALTLAFGLVLIGIRSLMEHAGRRQSRASRLPETLGTAAKILGILKKLLGPADFKAE